MHISVQKDVPGHKALAPVTRHPQSKHSCLLNGDVINAFKVVERLRSNHLFRTFKEEVCGVLAVEKKGEETRKGVENEGEQGRCQGNHHLVSLSHSALYRCKHFWNGPKNILFVSLTFSVLPGAALPGWTEMSERSNPSLNQAPPPPPPTNIHTHCL